MKALTNIPPAKYAFGLTKIFFKTGALGEIEEMRERKVALLILTVQAGKRNRLSLSCACVVVWSESSIARLSAARGWHARRRYRIMHSQNDAALAIQANVRAWIRFKKWGWWKLFCKYGNANVRIVNGSQLLCCFVLGLARCSSVVTSRRKSRNASARSTN